MDLHLYIVHFPSCYYYYEQLLWWYMQLQTVCHNLNATLKDAELRGNVQAHSGPHVWQRCCGHGDETLLRATQQVPKRSPARPRRDQPMHIVHAWESRHTASTSLMDWLRYNTQPICIMARYIKANSKVYTGTFKALTLLGDKQM